MLKLLVLLVPLSIVGILITFTAFHENDRRPVFAAEKGVFPGPAPAPLGQDALETLRARATKQAGLSSYGASAGFTGMGGVGASVRPPER